MSDLPPRDDDDETICFCIGVSRRQLREALHQGHDASLKALVRATGAMGGCMTCRIDIEQVMRDEAPLLKPRPPTDGSSDSADSSDSATTVKKDRK